LELPAGQICEGETPLEAGRREALKETGYEVPECKYLGWGGKA
jgi:8-oxo-dGTP pyrophosphatase MutT (NUDIX family)